MRSSCRAKSDSNAACRATGWYWSTWAKKSRPVNTFTCPASSFFWFSFSARAGHSGEPRYPLLSTSGAVVISLPEAFAQYPKK